MHVRSSLTEEQRASAVALFEVEWSWGAVAKRLEVAESPVHRLYDRWRVRGSGALMTKPTKRSFSFEFKLDIVRRFLAGETKTDLAREFDLSSPKLIETWARKYRNDGEAALRPKPPGRPRKDDTQPSGGNELMRLRRENERLRAEVAYLGKLRALMEQQRRSK